MRDDNADDERSITDATCVCCGGGPTDGSSDTGTGVDDPSADPVTDGGTVEEGTRTDDEAALADGSTDDRFLDGDGVLDDPVPDDLGRVLGRVLGGDPVATLGEWIDAVRERTGGGAIAVEDLCHTDEETGYWGRMDGERYDFRCFYDAVPVDVHTEAPEGTVIEFHATSDGELTAAPDGAVVSFGVDEAVSPPDGEPVPETVYAGVCPFVQAFADRAAYERWAADVPAATVAMPLADATAIADALAE
jgi:hypothetical protein